jgi:uncharacterized protein YbbK (DUF523 family)
MHKVLVSACLVGDPVRYDGTAAISRHPVLDLWLQEKRIVPFCPELAAGLGTPRPAVELVGGDGEALLAAQAKAMGRTGEDVTTAFIVGAMATVALCQRMGIQVAVLKEGSPSCGSARIHDGTFSGAIIPGQGVTVVALRAHGVSVFSEEQWEQAQARLSELV